MTDDPLSLSGESQGEFGRSFVLVLFVHLLAVVGVWLGGRFIFKQPAPESITWLDGGGDLGSAALPLPSEEDAATPAPSPEPEPELSPPPPPDAVPAPKAEPEIPAEAKATPTPAAKATPKATPKPAATPTPKPRPTPTPRAKSPTPKPKSKSSARSTPTPKKEPTPVKSVAKLATPRPGAKAEAPKITNSAAKPGGEGTGKGNAASGAGNESSAGTKGGPGAAGGTSAAVLSYFKKIEAQFHREWEQPLTVVRSGREVEAHVRLRAAADGTVESLTLVKPTGNHEVDDSIEKALRRVTKVERPPSELLQKGMLNEMVVFILEL